jgi:hypothetical protein
MHFLCLLWCGSFTSSNGPNRFIGKNNSAPIRHLDQINWLMAMNSQKSTTVDRGLKRKFSFSYFCCKLFSLFAKKAYENNETFSINKNFVKTFAKTMISKSRKNDDFEISQKRSFRNFAFSKSSCSNFYRWISRSIWNYDDLMGQKFSTLGFFVKRYRYPWVPWFMG